MEKLRKQIRESFFNPILHFLPLLVFLVVDEFFGLNPAWIITFPLTLVLLVYVYYAYNRILTWHLIFTLLFVVVGSLYTLTTVIHISNVFQHLNFEIILLTFFVLYFLFKKPIQREILKIVPKLIPMTNNFSELNRIVWKLFSLIFGYVLASFILFNNVIVDTTSIQLFQYCYIGLLIFLIVYELFRVKIIRAKLLREEWWPIVTDQGKIVGSIQHHTSLNDEKKYMHPIVRVLLIDKSMILMQKRSPDSLVYAGLWDTAISNHVKMGETIEECIERTAMERYSLANFKYMYLSNYTIETEQEHHYAFLFVSCQEQEFKINPTFVDQLKWWTQQQIEEELETGIFTENFKDEYDLLKRSGLLEAGKCECNCRLKEVIYQQSTGSKKE
jgi:isopentenyldiphosphate isomerase